MSETADGPHGTPVTTLRISVREAVPPENEAELLRLWLAEDDQLRAHGWGRPDDNMGSGEDILMFLLDAAAKGVGAALTRSLFNFIKNRRKRVTVTVALPDGTVVLTISSNVETAAELEELSRRIAEHIEQSSD
ncbi:effector-associated constant component EACC1 [Streptomyces profundus]|uniref:effector-associated constant component EACC1 n=1 Tax=Streptomyces profundus TaxID=2867410 RepID=UPI001D168F96|nr:hypothetical protein [Streptomyces sp. MA3_2.13]UED84958.1 hypothetical protein K4G22_12710 [Streptomyces sp. MA3_2.13]